MADMDSSVPDLAVPPEKSANDAADSADAKAEANAAGQDALEQSKPAETAAVPVEKTLPDQTAAQSIAAAPDATASKSVEDEVGPDPAAEKDADINAATKVQEEPQVEQQSVDDMKDSGPSGVSAVATNAQPLPDENTIDHEDYLRNEVADVIRSGLKELAKTRPPDPVGWLGHYFCTQAKLQAS